MARLVHITGESSAKAIARSGIRLGRQCRVIYFMPLVAGHYLSHQWARELTRQGVRNHVAVHFQLPDDLSVWHGRYHEQHREARLADGIAEFLRAPDQLGYEFFTTESVRRNRITAILPLRRPLGWRYSPDSHGRRPCGCPVCRQPGSYKSAAIRRAWLKDEPATLSEPEARQMVMSPDDDRLLFALQVFTRKKRRDDPSFLFHLLELEDAYTVGEVLRAVGFFAHPHAREQLERFAQSSDPEIRSAAEEGLVRRGWRPSSPS